MHAPLRASLERDATAIQHAVANLTTRAAKIQEVLASPDVPASDDDLVELEGETVRWGDLPSADRKAYLLGGYPF